MNALLRLGLAAAIVTGSVGTAVPSPATAAGTEQVAGSWAFALDVDAWTVPDQNIGTLDLLLDHSCVIRLRASFGGLTQGQQSSGCTWWSGGSGGSDAASPVDGALTATGITPTPLVLSFVAAGGGDRLLLLFDKPPPGVVGTGEAFRR